MQHVLSHEMMQWPHFFCDTSLFCITLTFYIKHFLWLNILIDNNGVVASLATLNNLTCGRTTNGSDKSPIYPSSQLTADSLAFPRSPWRATFKLSRPVILINSVYLAGVIIQNDSYNSSRQRLEVERLTSIACRNFFSRLLTLKQTSNSTVSFFTHLYVWPLCACACQSREDITLRNSKDYTAVEIIWHVTFYKSKEWWKEREKKSLQITRHTLPTPHLHLPNDRAGEGPTPVTMPPDCMVLVSGQAYFTSAETPLFMDKTSKRNVYSDIIILPLSSPTVVHKSDHLCAAFYKQIKMVWHPRLGVMTSSLLCSMSVKKGKGKKKNHWLNFISQLRCLLFNNKVHFLHDRGGDLSL